MSLVISEEIREIVDDPNAYLGAEFDDAIVSMTTSNHVVYLKSKILNILMEENLDLIEALEWFDYNIESIVNPSLTAIIDDTFISDISCSREDTLDESSYVKGNVGVIFNKESFNIDLKYLNSCI